MDFSIKLAEALDRSASSYIDLYSDKLSKIASKIQPNKENAFICMHMSYAMENEEHTETSVQIFLATKEVVEECGRELCSDLHLAEVSQIQSQGRIPVLVRRSFNQNYIDYVDTTNEVEFPLVYITSIAKPFSWASDEKPSTLKKSPKPLEKDLEIDLLNWMHSRGIQSDNQIQTSKHRMDIWIPGKCFLELKKGKVSGDDVCQAIDYCAEYKIPIILVGNHIGDMASRGIEAFNKAVESDMIAFVQWSAVRTYLKGLLSI